MIEIFASASIGAIVGFGVCAALTAGKVADAHSLEGPEPDCLNCADAGWVCENHPDMPWAGLSSEPHACDCGGAGEPCRICQWDMATAGISDEAKRAHKRVTDALNAKSARIQTLTDIARSQQSIKSGRILDVLEG